MKIKSVSLLVKILLIIIAYILCILHWMGKLPEATVQDIWYATGFAYGIGLGSIDFNIIRDNWIEKKIEKEEGRDDE